MVGLWIAVAVVVIILYVIAWASLVAGSRDDDRHGRG